jgi:hypothetical protein
MFGEYGKYLMLFGMMGVGVCKAYILTPFLFLSEYYNKESDKSKLTVWSSLNHIGDIIGILFAYVTVYELELRWELSYDICVFFYFMCALVFYLSVEERTFHHYE